MNKIQWHPKSDEPQCDCGDRIVCIVLAKAFAEARYFTPFVEVLEATEDGWKNENGCDFPDCECWAYERDITDTVMHMHVAGALDLDACAACGRDVRHEFHRRLKENNA